MKTNTQKRVLCLVLCVLLTATTAVLMFSCNSIENAKNDDTTKESATFENAEEIGEGEHEFYLVVEPDETEQNVFLIKTDEENVGPALSSLGLVSGEYGAYGLYIKTVCGVTADYDKDATYWAFYVDGEYSNYGVDSTPIVDGTVYTLKVSK